MERQHGPKSAKRFVLLFLKQLNIHFLPFSDFTSEPSSLDTNVVFAINMKIHLFSNSKVFILHKMLNIILESEQSTYTKVIRRLPDMVLKRPKLELFGDVLLVFMVTLV